MNKSTTVSEIHRACNQLQGAICILSRVEHETELNALKSDLFKIIRDSESIASRIESAEIDANCFY